MDGDDGDLVSFGEATRVQRVLEAIHASAGDRVALDGGAAGSGPAPRGD